MPYALAQAAHNETRQKQGATRMHTSGLRLSSIAIVSTLALASPARAQLLEHKDLTAAIALTIAQTAIETCKANGYAVSSTIVGRAGEIIVQIRGDGTGPHTVETVSARPTPHAPSARLRAHSSSVSRPTRPTASCI